MHDYRKDLTGAIKGNRRLRTKLDAANDRIRRLEFNIMILVSMLDDHGFGDDLRVRVAAWQVGWIRSKEVARKVQEAWQKSS